MAALTWQVTPAITALSEKRSALGLDIPHKVGCSQFEMGGPSVSLAPVVTHHVPHFCCLIRCLSYFFVLASQWQVQVSMILHDCRRTATPLSELSQRFSNVWRSLDVYRHDPVRRWPWVDVRR